jgi:hypothetical protein
LAEGDDNATGQSGPEGQKHGDPRDFDPGISFHLRIKREWRGGSRLNLRVRRMSEGQAEKSLLHRVPACAPAMFPDAFGWRAAAVR